MLRIRATILTWACLLYYNRGNLWNKWGSIPAEGDLASVTTPVQNSNSRPPSRRARALHMLHQKRDDAIRWASRYWIPELILALACSIRYLISRWSARHEPASVAAHPLRVGMEGHLMGRRVAGTLILSGVERYTEELVKHLCSSEAASCRVYTNFPYQPETDARFTNSVHARERPFHMQIFGDLGAGLVSVFHIPHLFINPLRMLPLAFAPVSVITVHDVIPLAYPLYASRPGARAFRAVARWCCRHADLVLVDSEFTRRDLERVLGMVPQQIAVVPLGVDERFHNEATRQDGLRVRERYGLPERYVLSVGRPFPHKNFPLLIRSMAKLKARDADLPDLVLAGPTDYGPGVAEVEAVIHELGAEPWIHWIGTVAEEDLPILYGGATVFAFPSLYEGFGLPVAEAMACGVPVVCSDAASLPEVVGEAGLLADATDAEAFAAALERVLTDPALCAQLAARGRERACLFRWEETARQTVLHYQEVAKRKGNRGAVGPSLPDKS